MNPATPTNRSSDLDEVKTIDTAARNGGTATSRSKRRFLLIGHYTTHMAILKHGQELPVTNTPSDRFICL